MTLCFRARFAARALALVAFAIGLFAGVAHAVDTEPAVPPIPTRPPNFVSKNPTIQSGPNLRYINGPVIANVKIAMVLYGTGPHDPHVAGTVPPSMPFYYQDIVDDCALDWLSEYSTPSQAIGRGTFLGMNRVTPSAGRSGSSLTDQNFRDELAHQIDIQAIPRPDANTLYMVHMDQGQTVSLGKDVLCATMGGYHSSFSHNGAPIYYAVLPDPSTCGYQTIQVLMGSAFHEIIEAITDPVAGKGWYDPDFVYVSGTSGAEVADICDPSPVLFTGRTSNDFTIETGWSNQRGTCYTGLDSVQLISPSNGAGCVSVSGTLHWSPVSGSTSYKVSISNASYFPGHIVEAGKGSSGSYSFGPLQPLTAYYWQVKAVVQSGSAESPSVVRSFVTGPNPPTMPVVSYPADGAVQLPANGQFAWQPVPGATNYHVIV